MAIKKEALSKEFLSQFHNNGELEDYFSDLYKQALQTMLEGELDNHLGYDKNELTEHTKNNYRNGKGKKKIKTKFGDLEIETPRDRNATFEPQIIRKRQSVLGKIEEAVIGLYRRGMSVRDIEEQVQELYGITISDTEVSRITNKLLDHIKQWQNRPLEAVYPVIWLDAIHVKVKENFKIISKAVYIIVGLNKEGYKEPLSIWVGENESSTFWMQALDDLKARGVRDIIVTASDNLPGLTKAIATVFPKSVNQICIIHQVRNSLNRVANIDKTKVSSSLKEIYQANNQDQAYEGLLKLEQEWGKKYTAVVNAWKKDWDNLTVYFNFTTDIRRLIYTTNIIENLNRNIRKYTKVRTMFPNDNAALKAVFMAVDKTNEHWQRTRVTNWQLVMAQFFELYPDRMNQ